MKAVVQRVTEASVDAEGRRVAAIGRGFLVLLGIGRGDDAAGARRLAAKVAGLRLFEDAQGRMNLGLQEVGGAVLCVSQFTLYGDVRRGRRPSFALAAEPGAASALYEAFCAEVAAQGVVCERGVFGAHMAVRLCNEGPVTLVLDSQELEQPRRP
ncbi:MAG: D-tyrosyl-tRNA(Tyr) deacylase [Dehalococcoidia bacterium]|nr:D-tyrosyl-tRNA(Tyr) deacylase [Dehalococcoidia bacterium]